MADILMSPAEYEHKLAELELTNAGFCRLIHTNPRTGRAWKAGLYPIPGPVAALLRLAAATNIRGLRLAKIINNGGVFALFLAQF